MSKPDLSDLKKRLSIKDTDSKPKRDLSDLKKRLRIDGSTERTAKRDLKELLERAQMVVENACKVAPDIDEEASAELDRLFSEKYDDEDSILLDTENE